MKHKMPYAFVTAALLLMLGMPAAVGQTPVGAQSSEQTSAPVHTYRLTFTVTELDSGKRVGVQHFAMTAVPGQHASVKQGSKVPLVTGGYSHETSPATQFQFTYIDVGLNIGATLTEEPDGVEAAIKLEQSTVADTPSIIADVKEPVIRQAVLENSVVLKPGTPVMVGSLDVPGSTRHLDIEVELERVM